MSLYVGLCLSPSPPFAGCNAAFLLALCQWYCQTSFFCFFLFSLLSFSSLFTVFFCLVVLLRGKERSRAAVVRREGERLYCFIGGGNDPGRQAMVRFDFYLFIFFHRSWHSFLLVFFSFYSCCVRRDKSETIFCKVYFIPDMYTCRRWRIYRERERGNAVAQENERENNGAYIHTLTCRGDRYIDLFIFKILRNTKRGRKENNMPFRYTEASHVCVSLSLPLPLPLPLSLSFLFSCLFLSLFFFFFLREERCCASVSALAWSHATTTIWLQ